MGLGNVAYALNQLDAAGTAYENAVKSHPDFADAWNNLAQVRSEQKRWPEAKAAIERAVSLGGPRNAGYEALLQTVLTQAR